ncbi:MAG: hypothetical protein H6525_00660 [Actinobacteria bacterium]|nr:hypothetical protein [Actinomycetota bacterium]MCB9411356.1 hypothetical protein [Actinomycetota bacterium]
MAYEDLPYDELRDKAFELAEQRHDLGFFYDLFRHTPAMNAMSTEGGSLGETSGSIIELVSAAREAFGSESVGEMEPLFVARFATYLREHGAESDG